MPNFRVFSILLIALLFSSVAYWFPKTLEFSDEKALALFQSNFDKEQEILEKEVLNFAKKNEQVENFYRHQPHPQHISLFVFEEDSLVFWNEDNTDFTTEKLLSANSIYHSPNAWHLKYIYRSTQYIYVGLSNIKNEFPFQNQFLKSNFDPTFELNYFKEIQLKPTPFPIVDTNNQVLFYLKKGEYQHTNPVKIFAFSCLLIGIYFFLFRFPKLINNYGNSVGIFTAILLRILLFNYLPAVFTELKLFDSKWFAISNLIPSLGDLVLHLLAILYISYRLHYIAIKHKSKWRIFYIFGFLVANFILLKLIEQSISSSIITFNFSNLFELNYLSIVGFSSFVIAVITYFQISHTLIQLLNKKNRSKIIIGLSLVITLISIHSTFQSIYYLWGIFILFFILQASKNKHQQQVLYIILLLICTSSVLSLWTNEQLEIRSTSIQRKTLEKLAEERDPIAEYLFNEVQNEIANDKTLATLASSYWLNKSKIDSYLKEKYFNGYWDKYQLNFSICGTTDLLYIGGEDVSCYDYYQERLKIESDMVSSSNLFRLANYAGRVDYIGEIKLDSDSNEYKLFAELSSIYLNENEGYPELLLDENSQQSRIDLTNLSYAVYNNGELVYHNGNYNYSTVLKISELSKNSFYQYITEHYKHIAYQKNDNVSIIISKSVADHFTFLTTLAYITVILSFFFIIFAFSLSKFPFYFKLNFYDFSTKIQLFLVFSILSSIILLAWGTTYYIKKQYEEKNANALEEKIRSVNFEIFSKIGQEEFLSNQLRDYVSNYLIKFSNVFYSDINIYDTSGELFSTSRPEVFNTGLKSLRMNPQAYQAMINDNKAQWIQKEQIGNQEYLSAYIPFKNNENEVLGYLNLPYFSKQGELEKEISSFLVSTLNIYTAIFALSLLISVLLINQLSKPLLLIRSQISKLKLGSSIHLIDWKSKDEIGALVNEYNRIAVELNESAEQLAKSEREEAWREMAKQVAHEIKNPLTPMKLSIQHLQMAANSNSKDLKDRINRTTKTLVEQIETLTNIATAFSSFAKLPNKKFDKINILPLLKNVIDLYSHNIPIHFNTKMESIEIMGDKDQLIRVFNNVIKNAVQAVEEKEFPQIKVELTEKSELVMVSVEDNGSGISDLQAERIFEPNFTTKSSGTGLGLAMTKSIIEQMDGKITFESVENIGTTFILQFKKA